MKVKITPVKPVPPKREFIFTEEEAIYIRSVLGKFSLIGLKHHLDIDYAEAEKLSAFSGRLYNELTDGLSAKV